MKMNIIQQMKTFFLLTFVILTLVGCGDNAKQKALQESIAQAKKDSITAAKVEQTRLDSLANYAWGELKFGISVKEAKEHNELFGKTVFKGKEGITYIKIWLDNYDKYKEALGLSDNLNGELNAYFEEDQLYQISIEGRDYDGHFNSILHDCDLYVKLIKKKYNVEPTYINKDIKSYKIEEGNPRSYASFSISDKRIAIWIGKLNHKHYYAIDIYNNNYPIKPHKLSEEQRKKEKEEKKEAKKIINNSL